MADQSWRDQPKRMSGETAAATAFRIGEHVRAHNLSAISLILHGGEPLLAGRELITQLARATRDEAGPEVEVGVWVQTNGVGLSEPFLALFDELGVQVGVSLDGAPEAHDRHRRFASGRGSHKAVAAGLERLTGDRYRHLFSGLLCTIDLRNDPLATYQALASYDPPQIDFLMPHGTWADPPPGRIPDVPDTPYADWLITVFDHWYHEFRTRIRLFDTIMLLAMGHEVEAEMVGLAPSRTLVIETDGAIEQSDLLKVAYEGAPATGLHVRHHSFDQALHLPGMIARQLGEQALAPKCRQCHVLRECGGGLYAYRYRPGRGFANPSVYCPDLMALIDHIKLVVDQGLSTR